MKKKMLIGTIVTATLVSSIAYGGQISKKIDVVMNSINIMVNNQKVEAENILYNGTTYVPLRTVAQILNKEVGWEAKTNTANIKDKDASKNRPVVTIEMSSGEKIKLELYPEVAPNTVNNFIALANKGFYNNLIFHRVMPNFVIQGGDPKGTGMGGPGYSIKGEFMKNGVQNSLMHTRGVISMARTQEPDSAGSQFFIVVADAPFLNGDYSAFGRVIEGMDIVDKIVNVKRDGNDKPEVAQTMKKVTVDTLGKVYDQPQVIK